MNKLDKMLEQSKFVLNNYVKQLEILDLEKKKIVSLCKNASLKDRVNLEEKMKASEEKYKKLYEEVTLFALQVKKMKKQCC